MRIKFKTADLIEALDSVAIVPPRPLTPKGDFAGYLFVVRGDICFVYSRDAQRVARATISILEAEGEGSFIYPSAYVDAFKFVGDEVTFDVSSENDAHTLKYTTRSGATAERTSCNPSLLAACDKDLEEASEGCEFPVAILREALGSSRVFLPKPKDEKKVEEHFNTIQIFDNSKPEWEKSNGYLYASNSTQSTFFYSDAFLGKYLAVHGSHLGALGAFLSKSAGSIRVRIGKSMTFVVDDKGRVFGWVHTTKTHSRITYYALKQDQIVLMLSADNINKALRYIRTELETKHDRVRINFDEAGKTLQIQISESTTKATSFLVPVDVLQNEVNRGFSYHANINHLLDLFNGLKGQKVMFRIAIVLPSERRPKESACFRTIDEFWMDDEGKVLAGSDVKEEDRPVGAHRCRVTRFMPSMS